jgi:hypothetical protein
MKNRIRYLCLLALPAGLILLGFLFPEATQTGTVSGVEFCPQTFTHRSFKHFQAFGIQVTPRKNTEFKTAFDSFVNKQGHVSSTSTTPIQWRFIKGSAPGLRGWHGPQKSACKTIGCFSQDDDDLVRWLEANSAIAALLVPELVRAIQQEQYDYLFLLKAAFFTDSVEECAQAISQAKQLSMLKSSIDTIDSYRDIDRHRHLLRAA